MLLTDLIIWSGTGLFFRRGGISRTGCTVKHWISGSDHSGIKRHYMMESMSIQPCVKIYKQIAGRDMSDFQWLGFNTQIHQKVKYKLKKKEKGQTKNCLDVWASFNPLCACIDCRLCIAFSMSTYCMCAMLPKGYTEEESS